MNKIKTLKERVSELMIELGLDGSYYYVETLEAMKLYGKEVAKNVRHTSIELVNKHSHVVEIQRGKGVRIVSDVDNLNRDIMNIQFSEIDPK